MPKEPKKSRSGTTRSYAERKEAGRSIVSHTMTDEAKALLSELATHHGLSRSAVLELAIRELHKKMR